jgi:hypothetical protein
MKSPWLDVTGIVLNKLHSSVEQNLRCSEQSGVSFEATQSKTLKRKELSQTGKSYLERNKNIRHATDESK